MAESHPEHSREHADEVERSRHQEDDRDQTANERDHTSESFDEASRARDERADARDQRAENPERFALVNVDLASSRQASITAGIAELDDDDRLEDLIRRADEALYQERRERNAAGK